jgi:hypothetical protein
MRVTRDSLIRIARETSQQRSFSDSGIIAAYLTGSLAAASDPMLGGTTDIDLVLVHAASPSVSREIVKLTPDFHLDIHHRSKSDFRSPRELRADPLLGYEMYDPMLLSESEKFFEFVQASLRAGFEFHAPSLVLTRCRKLLAGARKDWVGLTSVGANAGPLHVLQFLDAVAQAADAVAELSGGPLSERRFLLEFPGRAEAAERPDFTEAVFNLIGASQVDAASLVDWLPPWAADFLAAAQDPRVDQSIDPARLNYYDKGIQALLAGETPLTALWPLIHTWTLASQVLEHPPASPWQAAFRTLGLLGPELERRVSDLDGLLDQVEVRIDEIAIASGVESPGKF